MFSKTICVTMLLIFSQSLFGESNTQDLSKLPHVSSDNDNSNVELILYENEEYEKIGKCFTILVKNWEPGDSVQIIGLSPKKEKVTLIEGNRKLPVSPEGIVKFSIPYKHENLYTGEWLILVLGKSGAHGHPVIINNSNGF